VTTDVCEDQNREVGLSELQVVWCGGGVVVEVVWWWRWCGGGVVVHK